jgi:hypothetical protein
MAPEKKTVERTAASSRPKRTPKPTTVATSSTPAPKSKKNTTATKKAAPKKVATGGVTKKAAPKKAAPKKATVAKKAAPKKAAAPRKAATTKTEPKKAAPTYQKWVVKADGSNPFGPAADKKIAEAKAAEKAHQARVEIDLRYLDEAFIKHLEHSIYAKGRAAGQFRDFDTFDAFFDWSKETDLQAWEIAHKQKIGAIESQYHIGQANEMKEKMYEKRKRGEIPHIDNMTDYLHWEEIEKERAKIIEDYKMKERKKHHHNGNVNGNGNGNGNGNVSAISSPVKKAQNAIVNASPVKKAQEAFAGGGNRSGRPKSPEKRSPEKNMTSNDSGYQADIEQHSVMSRTWELAANAVEAMRSAVVLE